MQFDQSPKTMKLRECAAFQEGYVNPSQLQRDYFGHDVKWLRAVDLNDSFVRDTSRRLSVKGYESAGKSALLFQPGTLAISKSGTIGRLGILTDYMCGNRAVINIRVDERVCDTLFVFYTLRHLRSRITELAEGSVQKNLYISVLGNIEILVPRLSEQQLIGRVLNALDRRIESLHESSVALEAIARAIFKSWFIDFDPVRAKAKGRVPNGMDAATAALFPSEFQDSELGDIPTGWRVDGFGSSVIITSGGTPKTSMSDYWGGDIPWFSIVDAPSSSDVFVIDTEKRITSQGLANCAARLLPVGATIISARGTVGKLAITGVPMAINQSCYALLPKSFGDYGTFFQTGCLVDTLQHRAHGAVFSTITRDTLSSVRIVTPPKPVAQSYEETVSPLMSALLNNRSMSKTLGDLRDALLPRLISGKLRVVDAEKLVEAVI